MGKINLDLTILNEIQEINKLSEQKEDVINFINSLSYDNKESFENLKQLKQSFNQKRLDWFNGITEPAKAINKELLEIENTIKEKEIEFAKVDAEKSREIVNALYKDLYSQSIEMVDEDNKNILIEFKQDIILKLSSYIYNTTSTGEIKLIKGSYTAKGQIKAKILEEIKTFLDNLSLFNRLNEIGQTKFKENGFDYIGALDFEEEQRRIIEKELREKKVIEDLEKQDVVEAYQAEKEETNQAVEKVNEDVVVSNHTTFIVEIPNDSAKGFREMLIARGVTFEIK